MGKQTLLLLLFCLIFSACSQTPQSLPENSEEIGTILGSASLPPVEAEFDENGIPYCKPHALLPLQSGSIIKIDDVVENCSFYKEKSFGNAWGGGGMQEVLTLFENQILVGELLSDEGSQAQCFSKGEGPFFLPSESSKDFIDFLKRYQISEQKLLKNVMQDSRIDQEHYFCPSKRCNILKRKDRGEQDGHYFVYGNRANPASNLVIIDGQLYDAGAFISNEYLVEEGPWNIVELFKHKIKVAKYTQGTIYPVYKNNIEGLYSAFDQHKSIGTFYIQVCEISLKGENPSND